MKFDENKLFDVNFDFTSDTPHYWDNCWEVDPILGTFYNDPDSASKTLQHYHKLLWSKQLPNGDFLNLKTGSGANYLTWKDMRFSSDSITASFRYKNNRKFMELVANTVPNYNSFVENYIHRSYTIGGTIIFPKHSGGINQSRGCNYFIRDRWDLTLECIRRFYNDENSPLYPALKKDKDFFDLFVDFRSYVDYFFLQDCVSNDYNSIIFWLGNGDFTQNPLPKTVEEYLHWINNELDFVEKRNTRINSYFTKKVESNKEKIG